MGAAVEPQHGEPAGVWESLREKSCKSKNKSSFGSAAPTGLMDDWASFPGVESSCNAFGTTRCASHNSCFAISPSTLWLRFTSPLTIFCSALTGLSTAGADSWDELMSDEGLEINEDESTRGADGTVGQFFTEDVSEGEGVVSAA